MNCPKEPVQRREREKTTDQNNFLYTHSCHPLLLEKSLPLSQLHRIKHICSTENLFEVCKTEMWKKKGYKDRWLDSTEYKLKAGLREPLLDYCIELESLKEVLLCSLLLHIQLKLQHYTETPIHLQIRSRPSENLIIVLWCHLKNSLVKADVHIRLSKLQSVVILPDNCKCGNCTQCQIL